MRTRPAPLRPFLFALAALALATPSQADGIQQLRQFLQHAQQGSGHFEQIVYAPTGTSALPVPTVSAGTMSSLTNNCSSATGKPSGAGTRN